MHDISHPVTLWPRTLPQNVSIFYLDDLLILSHSPEEAARRDTITVINHHSSLGFAIKWEKSFLLPSCRLVYLGLCLDLATMTAKLSPLQQNAVLLALNLYRRRVTALSIMRLLGLMAAAHPVIPLCLIFLHRLKRWLARQWLVSRRHKLRVLSVPRSVSPKLEYWGSPPSLLRDIL